MKLGKVSYLYHLDYDYKFYIPQATTGVTKLFRSADGNVRLRQEGKWFFISRGYAWDGCSPKLMIDTGRKQYVFGTPEGKCINHNLCDAFYLLNADDPCSDIIAMDYAPKLKYASLLHDVLCQFRTELEPHLQGKVVEQIFWQEMCKARWPLAELYYVVTRLHSMAVKTGLLSYD